MNFLNFPELGYPVFALAAAAGLGLSRLFVAAIPVMTLAGYFVVNNMLGYGISDGQHRFISRFLPWAILASVGMLLPYAWPVAVAFLIFHLVVFWAMIFLAALIVVSYCLEALGELRS